MKILNKLKSNTTCLGLCLAGCLLWSRVARAEVTLVDKDGWIFSFDGRVNAFLSGGSGKDLPQPTVDPNGNAHSVMGANASGPGNGRADVGWPGAYGQQDPQNNYLGVRVRSGMFGNIMAFSLTRRLSETSQIKGYISIWSTVESLGRDKWSPLPAEAREGYFTGSGNWGSITVGRTLGWLGRMSYEIDVAYGHGYGLGLPCTDALGPACGHIGTGVLFPGYSAGISYSTPSLGGFQLHGGLYDPIVFASAEADWSHASYVRPEGAATFDKTFGPVKLKVGVEGLYQTVSRIKQGMDANGATTRTDVSTAVWGASGGGRIEIGPLRLGGAAFKGKGIGLAYALQRSVATADNDPQAIAPGSTPTYELRTFTGFYGQSALVLGDWQLSAGYGLGAVDQLPSDKMNSYQSVFHYQAGISAAVYYHLTENIVLAADYFRYMAAWYGAPAADPQAADGSRMLTGQRLAGETQVLNFLNVGVTYHW